MKVYAIKTTHESTFPVTWAEVHLTHKLPSSDRGSCSGCVQSSSTGAAANAIPTQGLHMRWVMGEGSALLSFVRPLNLMYFLEVKVMKWQQHCYAQTNLHEAVLG